MSSFLKTKSFTGNPRRFLTEMFSREVRNRRGWPEFNPKQISLFHWAGRWRFRAQWGVNPGFEDRIGEIGYQLLDQHSFLLFKHVIAEVFDLNNCEYRIDEFGDYYWKFTK